MNVVTIIGNLTKDPEVRYNGEKAICRMTVAVNDRRRNPQTGEWEDDPSFIPVVVFDRQAQNCERFLSKGRKVAVQGRIKTGSYIKQDGTKVYTTDVIASNVEFLNTNQENPQPRQEMSQYQPQYQAQQMPPQDGYVTRQQYEMEKQQGAQTSFYPPNGFQKVRDDDIPF